MGDAATEHGDYHYDVVASTRAGNERMHDYASQEPLTAGDVLGLEGRYWLIEGIDGRRAVAKPAVYQVVLRHPDGRVERGTRRRFRPGAPGLGHTFSTVEDGQAVCWSVVEQRLEREDDEPFIELIAERDFSEVEELPDHELEHALASRQEDELPAGAAAAFERAAARGLSIELVALEPGEEPDWSEAQSYIDALVLEEIEDDLLELCGVNPDRDARETWPSTVRERLGEDLRSFRDDIAGDHDEIEEWDFRRGRIFAATGSPDDESDPTSGFGWMCRLLDSGALTAARFERVRKAELELFGG